MTFFAENGLSAEGLSRAEVKAVYRDITEMKFSYGKTAEVIRKAVPGWEIQQREPSPEELAVLWARNLDRNAASQKGLSYRIDETSVLDETLGFGVLEKSMLECWQGEGMLWRAEFREFYVEDYALTQEGIVVWGRNDFHASVSWKYVWIIGIVAGIMSHPIGKAIQKWKYESFLRRKQ